MIYEGAVMTGFEGNALRVAGKTESKNCPEVAPNAAAISLSVRARSTVAGSRPTRTPRRGNRCST